MNLEERLQVAFEHLSGDPGLTSDLRDSEAKLLLDWAEAQVKEWVVATEKLDDEGAWAWLAPRLRRLRAAMRQLAEQSASAQDPTAMLMWLLASSTCLEDEEHVTHV